MGIGGTIAGDGVAPTRPDARIETLDVLRGVAICGILLMNIPYMGRVGESPRPLLPARWDADWISWGIQTLFLEGTMRGLFTLLFGAGMLLMLRQAEGTQPQVAPFDVWARRCVGLMLLGVVQFLVFIWPGEILFNYGLTGLVLLAFRTARPKTILAVAAALILILSVQSGVQAVGRVEMLRASVPAAAARAAGKTLTEEQKAALDAAEEIRKTLHPTPSETAKLVKERTHLGSLMGWSFRIWSQYNLSAFWIADAAESLAFMLIGMALFRAGILTGTARPSTYRWMMAVGYGGGIAARAIMLLNGARVGFDFDPAHISLPAILFREAGYEPARLLITLGHVGLLVTLFRSGALGRAAPARALGRMALTTYSLQSILTSILFYALGWLNAFGFAALMGIAASIWIATALFSLWWLERHEMGPAERLLRAFAYGEFRRPAPRATLATSPPL